MKSVLLMTLAVTAALAGEVKLGKPFTINESIGIDKLTAAPEKYVGKVVQVKGSVRDVCRLMGCWMELVDPENGKSIRIKVTEGEIQFPKEAIGKTAVAEGKLTKVVLTREEAIAQAKHEAETNGKKFDPESIKSGVTYYQIQGTGAIIVD